MSTKDLKLPPFRLFYCLVVMYVYARIAPKKSPLPALCVVVTSPPRRLLLLPRRGNRCRGSIVSLATIITSLPVYLRAQSLIYTSNAYVWHLFSNYLVLLYYKFYSPCIMFLYRR